MKTYNEIDIKYYDNDGNIQVRCSAPVTQDALVHYELMQSHYCKLSFKLSKPIYFLLGDFIDTPYGRFELIDLTKAKDNDTIGYSYEILFDAYYRKFKNKILKYRPNTGSQEATFSLTSTISTHVEVIMKSLAYYAKLDKSYLYDPKFEGEGTDYTYVIDASVDANAAKLITYSNTSMLDAIANIAQTFGCEWWFEGNILHFGTCENTNAITDFRLNDNIVSMSSSQSQSTYANRVYAFGAARNLPSGYKNDADADITKDGVVEKRLMLPNSAECSDKNKQLLAENGFELKNGYIQVSGLREDQYVEGVTTNDDIYPRNLIKTSKVTSYEKDVEDESTPEEGDFIKRTFYRVNSLSIINEDGEKTGDMAFRKSYILSGKNLHIVFQSGSLNGMDFECEFNPDGVEEILKDDDGNPILKDGKEQINPKSQVFEIVANEDYGRFLPDTTLHPKEGDTFVLYNWDSTKLGDTLVSAASNELLTDAIKDLKKSMIDPTTYTCTAEANYSYNQGRGNLHGVGDRVNLYNKGYGDSYRASRIIGYEFCLDIPYDGAKYYVGEKPSYSRLNAMESKIEELVYNGQSYLNGNGGGGKSIYIIKSYDKTAPTDYNVYSARAIDEQRLNKTKDDTAQGTITFEKVQKFLKGMKVGANGDWTLDELDNTHLTTDYLQVRMKAIFETLEILHTDTLGGELFITPVGSNRILKVEEVNITYDGVSQKAYRCYFLGEQDGSKVENKWKVGDQARSKSFNLTAGKYHNVGNHYYWRLVIGVSSEAVKIDGKKYHYVDLSDIDKDAASDEPMVDDILNQCGNRTDITRQSCLVFSAVDTYSPCITLYHGVDGYTFNNKEYVNYGVNHSTNKAFFHVYGDMYFGDRPTSANNYEGDSYVKYDSDKKKVTIKGDLDIKSTYDGKTLDKYITEKSLDKNAVETIIKKSETITDLQNQIDGAIETWFYDGVPTLSNAPAIGWTTDKDKKTHLGDLYYDNKTGKAYRFAKDGSTYKWIIITDTELTKAIEDSSQALKDAKSKRRIFGSQPVPPYDVNDMWVNATYPSDGSTYKNEILKCSTSKAEGEEFDIADWKLASKYTDDTKAEEAKKAAEKAQAEIKNTQTNLITLGTTVSNNKKAFDVFTSDGYLDSSEIAAIAQDSKRLEDDYNAAVESYNNVVGSKFLLDKDGKETTYKTDLVSAKATLDSAKNELITYLSDIVSRYNASDSNGKATIKAAAAQKYTNFTNAYKAFYDKLGVANNYITSNLFDGLNTKLITNMAGLEYIKAALVDGDTVVKGGLILSTLIALRNDKGNVTAGINGVDTKENGIALWLGGKAIDKQASTTTEEEKKIAAKSLLRFDGTGYFANGNLWWDADGTLHADPTSFIINKNNVGVQLALFAPVWKSGTTDTTKLANVLSIDPQKPFTHLDVSGNVTTEGSLKIGGIYLSYDSANNALRLSKDAAGKEAANFYATGGITAYGAGASTTGGGGGLNGSVKSYSSALKLTSESLSEMASAYSIKALDTRISSLEGGSATAISVSGSGNAVTSVTKNGTTISVVKGSTFLTSHQSLDGYVNAISVSGSGNAITSVSKSGKGITFTKGATFLTSHQSLANYYTKSSVDSLLSGKSATSHTHSVIINGTTKIIAASGGTAVNLGTYLTSHQSLADYAKKSEIPTKVSQLTNDAGYLTTHQSLADYYTRAEIDAKGYTTNKGTVTSVGLTLPTGLTCAINTITTSGTFAVTFASGYSIPTTTKQSSWDSAVSVKHSHSNKTVLDGITSTKVTNWDSAYRWYSLITTDEETADGIINKWNEVVNFLANIAQTDTLSGIIDGINTSISNEVSRAKKAEGTNASNISANKTSITTLQGYFTSGSAKKALQLTTARNLWGNAFNGTSDVNGSIVLPSDKYISIGNIKLEYDAINKALKITNTTTDEVANLYASGGVSAYGVGSVAGSGGGGLNGTIVPYSTAITSDPQNEGSKIASASSIYKLHSRISAIENNGATSITVTGTGNAITSVSKNGTSITFTKGATFLTSHQSLANYYTKGQVNNIANGKSSTSHTHSVKINGVTKTIAATGGTAVDLGTYLTSHQSLADYAKKSEIPTKVSQLTNDAGYLTTHQSLADYYTRAEIDAKGYTTNKGTVTSVGLTLPTGLTCAINTITTSGTFAVTFASGYSIPTTTKQSSWDSAVSVKHSHSNKTVLDGITSTKVTNWDSAYRWYSLITTDEETADGIINKWNEVVNFLANIAQTDTLSGIIDGINTSISNEVSRAKKAEGTNASNISANKTSITTLQGYFTSGSAKKALQLTTARNLWGNAFNGTSDVNGSIVLPSDKYISIGNIKLEYDAINKALKITNTTTDEVANLYASGGVSAYGVGSVAGSGGGGLNGTIVPYSTAITSDPQNEGSKIASASSIYKLHSRISAIENNGATSITVTGTGNAITSVSKNGTSITFTKGATFLTSHQSLANYYTKGQVNNIANGKSSTSHTHSVKINGVTKTIAATGGTAVDLGTYLTSHQSLADYAKKSEIPTKVSQLTNDKNFVTGSVSGQTITINGVSTTWQNTWRGITDSYSGTSTGTSLSQKGANSLYNALHNGYASSAGNSDTVDGYHASGLLTALSNSNNGISITVGGTTKSISNISVNHASNADTATTSSMLKTANWNGGRYVPSDTHYMCLGYMNCTAFYDSLTLLVTSAFWGNQHGSQDIITIQQSTNTNDTARIQTNVGRIRLGGSYERSFYYYKDDSRFRLYLYVYVIGGDSYGRWNISYLGGNATWVTDHQENVTKSSSWIGIGYSAQVNYASSAGSSGSASKVYGQVESTGSHELVRCDMNNDHFRIIAGSSGNNKGWAEIATADDGNEPIYVRQYSGVFSSVVRTLTLLDANGYTHFPSYINIGGNENNNSSPDRVWGSNGSDSYLRSYRTSALNVNYAASAGNADTVDGEHASAFTRIVGRHRIFTSETAPYKYIHLFRIANSSGYSTVDCEIDIRTRYHSAKIEIRISTAEHPYNNGGSSISIVKKVASGRTCNIWVLPTVQSSNYNYYDVYYESGAWNAGSYGITLKGSSGNLVFEHKGINLTSLPDNVTPVSNNIATSATKLQTPRTIWGQSFDGTGNVSGSLSEVGNIHFKVDDSYDIGSDAAASRYIYTRWLGARSGRKLELGANNSGFGQGLCIDTNLNVGISTNTPAYKLHVVGNIYSSATIRTAAQNKAIILSNDASPAWISALEGQVIFNTGKAIRFGETAWDWNQWAGLKYTHSNKTIYLGIADGSAFNANSAQSDGTLRLAGITTITPDSGARIGGSGGNLYLGNANDSGWVCTQSICSQTNSSLWSIRQDGNAYFSNINVAGTATIGGDTTIGGNCLAKGGVTAYQSSDVRLKTNINKLNCLNVIKSIGGTYEFDYIRDHKHSIGFIAQNVNNPLLKDIVAKDDNGYLKINYWNPKLISLAFGALTEIDDEVDKLKARVRELESEVEYLKNKNYVLQ